MSPLNINTYHCAYCTNLLLATTHTISTLPKRKGTGDGSFILPVSGVVPRFGGERERERNGDGDGDAMDGISAEDGEGREGEREDGEDVKDGDEQDSLPSYGYTNLLALTKPSKQVIVRKEDGFEKRGVWKCGRCAVAVGYEVWAEGNGGAKGKGVEGEGEGQGEGGFEGKILYLLRGSVMSTAVLRSGKKGMEGDAEVLGTGVGVWE
ncbi:uncharacterized protein EAE98_011232 [Botrytis deweyae]|uniref:STEEP1 domain-containing protein n=1 Tax=Botrytis deweyae TaxID=2478750 RepID=A0ABQ7I6M6_9HELO|nr:uncharacterized protein EAE98_011232 [Botrytis deweyae]KAF7915366.1 hypothetical protein EAE98_011232 [Botrytis deweyae]